MSKFWDDIRVERRSLSEIETVAETYRTRADYSVEDRLVVDTLCGRLNIALQPRSERQMAGALALAASAREQDVIFVSRELSKALREDDTDARFVFFHEVGHLALHRGAAMKPRMATGNVRPVFVREDESGELQANCFARALTLPRSFPFWDQADELIGRIVGIPTAHVEIRRLEIKQKKSALSENVRTGVERSLTPSSGVTAREAILRLELWEQLPAVPGQDPTRYRLCGNFQIRWEDFGKQYPPHDTAWIIIRGQIRSVMDERPYC